MRSNILNVRLVLAFAIKKQPSLLHQYTYLEPTILLPTYYLLATILLSRTLKVAFCRFFCMIIHCFVYCCENAYAKLACGEGI